MASILDPHGNAPVQPSAIPTQPTPQYLSPTDQLQAQDSQYSWLGDLGHEVASGGGDMGASLSAAVGWLAGTVDDHTNSQALGGLSSTMDDWSHAASAWSQGQMDSLSPYQKDLLSQPFFSGVMSNPVGYLGGQTAKMAPALVTTLAATALTGGIADIMGAGVGLSEATAAAVGTGTRTAAMFGSWGTLSAGDVMGQIQQAIDSVPDKQLQATNPIYAGYRNGGMSEDDARQKYARDTAGLAPAVAFTIGGLAGVMGGPGQLARAFGGDVAGQVIDSSGLIKRTIGGALVGGTVGGVQAGATNALEQGSLAKQGLGEFDTGSLVDAVLTGTGMGAVMGAVAEGPLHSIGKALGKDKGAKAEAVPEKDGNVDSAVSAALAPPEATPAPQVAPEATPVTPAPAPAPVPAPVAQEPTPVADASPVPVQQAPQPAPQPTPEPAPIPTAVSPAPAAEPTPAPVPVQVPSEVTAPGSTPTPAATEAVAKVEAPLPPKYITDKAHKAVFTSATGKNDPQAEAAIKALANGTGRPVAEVRDEMRAATKGMPKDNIAPYIYDQLSKLVDQQKKDGVVATPKAGHRTKDEVQQRQDMNTSATEIADAHKPNPDAEGAAMGSANGGKQAVEAIKARAIVAARVKAMAENAHDLGLPHSIENNVAGDRGLNGDAMLLMEARALDKSIRAGKATGKEYGRFLTNESLLRSGKVDEYVGNRRAEGDAAMKPKGKGDVENVAATAPIESGTSVEKTGEQVVTKTLPSASRTIKAFDEETAKKVTSEVRHPVITAEEKAAIEAKANGKAKVEEIKAKVAADKAKSAADKAKSAKPTEPVQPKLSPVEKAKATAKAKLAEARANKERPAPKPEPKPEASTAERVTAAAKETETKPTEAQKVAGNYAKGHVSIHGLDITIENPRGSTREGTGPDGKKWSVTMPDHYGYIKRTEGADGDHVDVHIGKNPDSDHVFVVDQRKTGTEQFDEHKVMLGYDNAAQAMDAYERSFSDGKAHERFGGLKPMSMDEFKDWLKHGDTTKPTNESVAAAKELAKDRGPKIEELGGVTREGNPNPYIAAHNDLVRWLNGLSDKDFVNLQEKWGDSLGEEVSATETPQDVAKLKGELQAKLGDTPKGPEITTPSSRSSGQLSRAKAVPQDDIADVERLRKQDRAEIQWAAKYAVRSDHLGTMLGELTSRDGLSPMERVMMPQVVARLRALAGQVPVHVLPDGEADRLFGKDVRGQYHGLEHAIVLRQSAIDTPHTLVHEAVHAAFFTALKNDKFAQEWIDAVSRDAQGSGAELAGGDYALTNADEFLSEAFSNPEFQDFLAHTPVSQDTADLIGLSEPAQNLWETMLRIVQRVLRLPAKGLTLLDAMMRVGARLDRKVQLEGGGKARGLNNLELHNLVKANGRANHADTTSNLDVDRTASQIADSVRSAAEEAVARATGKERMNVGRTPWFMGVRTMDQIAQTTQTLHTFEGNPVRAAFNAIQRIATTARNTEQKWAPDLASLQKVMDKYRGPVADDFASLMHDSTIAGVWPNKDLAHPDNAHITKSGYTDAWQRAAHGELKIRYDALPKELQATYDAQARHYSSTQDKATLALTVNRILTALGVTDKGMAQRVIDGAHTPADEAALGDSFKAVKQAGALSRLQGPYFPLMRRGDFVVRGSHPVADPKAAGYVGREGRDYVFNDKAAAAEFATNDEKGNVRTLRPSVEGKWVDKTTGSEFGVEPTTRERVRITSKDTDAEMRYFVHIQNQHTEFVKTKDEAQKLAYDLTQQGLKDVDAQPRENISNNGHGALMSHDLQQVMNQIEKGDAYQKMTPTAQQAVKDAVDHIAVRLLGENRIQTRALPRRYVAGASKDVVKNSYVYNKAMANYLARLEHGPALDAAMTDMHDQARNDHSKPNSFGRMAVFNEISKRVNTYNPMTGDTGKFSPVMKRVMMLSFLDKMLSPAHSVVHMIQPAMLNFPLLAGRHGVGAAARAMARAYGDIGALDTFTKGVKDTAANVAGKNKGSEFMSGILARAKNANERGMLEHLMAHGSIDPDAGFELGHMISDSQGLTAGLDKTINYFDGIARPFPRAVEAVNRSATALAAYRLEMAKTGDHAKAVSFAQDTVNMGEGVYNDANAAPIFNHPLARLSLQFKKYGQMVYGLIGHEIGKAWHNANPGDRAEAVKTLVTMAAMHIAVAGVLGLPTEPFKLMLMAANAAGLTDIKWSDVENMERETMARIAGKQFGEVISQGMTRAIPGGFAFDVTHRLGLSDLMTFGEPKSEKPDDLWSYFGELIGGAPASLGMDYISGAQALSQGDYGKAAGLLIPMKQAADSIAAYQKLTEGKSSQSGNQTMAPYSIPEAVTRVFGFTPAREFENSALQNSVYEDTQRATTQHTSLQQDWYKASPSDRLRLWGQIEKFNAGQPAANKLTRAKLDGYVKLRDKDVTSGRVTNGLLVTPRNRNIMDNAQQTYNN